MTNLLQRILPTVQKPARYTGGEYNQVVKPLEQVDVRIAFCFPDTYELGMSNLGMRILYGVMNEMEGVWCQRGAEEYVHRRCLRPRQGPHPWGGGAGESLDCRP